MGKKEQASQPALQTLKEYAVITAAVLIMDIGIYVFKFPNNFSFGGVSGMAVVICRFLPFTASQINLFINLLLLLVGFAVLGRNFGVKTAYVTVLSSVPLNIFEKLFPMAHPLTNEIMLELCFAIILPALAAAKAKGIDYAADVYPHYGSDVEATLRGGADARHALIGAGVYASHGYERSHVDGVKNTLELLAAYLDK